MTRWAASREIAAVFLALAVAAALVAFPGAQAAPFWPTVLSVGLVLGWIAAQDLADFTIPDGAVAALAALGAGARIGSAAFAGEPLAMTLAGIIVDAAVAGGCLLAVRQIYYRRRGRDGLGLGDVKLAGAGGVLVGTIGFAWALFGASLAGLALAACRGDRGRRSVALDKLPFGAILAPALGLVWLAAQWPGLAALIR